MPSPLSPDVGFHPRSAEPLIGSSPPAEELERAVAGFSLAVANLVIFGEPGSGKRFLARRIHEGAARRARAPFIEVSPRVPGEELRVILFDEERAKQEGIAGRPIPRLGRRSTLFVRNVHEFPLLSQTRVARFLIQNERVPPDNPNRVRVIFSLPAPWNRIVAVHRVIDSLDTYCHGYPELRVPALRERREDIPAFVEYFLRAMNGGRSPSVGPAVMAELLSLPYHDNVRELRLLLAEVSPTAGGEILALPDVVRDEITLVESVLRRILEGGKTDLEAVLNGLEKALVRRALIRSDFDRTRAAAMLGLTDLNFRYRLKKFRLRAPLPGHTRDEPPDPAAA